MTEDDIDDFLLPDGSRVRRIVPANGQMVSVLFQSFDPPLGWRTMPGLWLRYGFRKGKTVSTGTAAAASGYAEVIAHRWPEQRTLARHFRRLAKDPAFIVAGRIQPFPPEVSNGG